MTVLMMLSLKTSNVAGFERSDFDVLDLVALIPRGGTTRDSRCEMMHISMEQLGVYLRTALLCAQRT